MGHGYCLEKISTMGGKILLQKLGAYESIGTPDECRQAMETMKAYEVQYPEDISDPLEPLKISSALKSETLKLRFRKGERPDSISPLDYTVIAALKEALEKRCRKIDETPEETNETNEKEWVPADEPPKVDDNGTSDYILLSFDNFDVPLVGRYETYEDGSGTYYVGDSEDSCLKSELFVNAWMPLPKPYRGESE